MKWIKRNSIKGRHKLKGLPCPFKLHCPFMGQLSCEAFGSIWVVNVSAGGTIITHFRIPFLWVKRMCGMCWAPTPRWDWLPTLLATCHNPQRPLWMLCSFLPCWAPAPAIGNWEQFTSSVLEGAEGGYVNCAFQIIWLIINRTWRSILESRDTIPQSPSSCS